LSGGDDSRKTSVRCWGYAGNGRLGIKEADLAFHAEDNPNYGDDADEVGVDLQFLGVDNVPNNSSAEQLAVGSGHSCVLLSDHSVWCWGYGQNSQLGQGSSLAASWEPVRVQGLDAFAPTHIISGREHVCAYKAFASDSAYCWGKGLYGRLGTGDESDVGTPVKVTPKPNTFIEQIVTANFHTCALLTNHEVYCWGNGAEGRLGNEDVAEVLVPPTASLDLGATDDIDVKSLATGSFAEHGCALMTNGALRCWGPGANGRLGYASEMNVGDVEATMPPDDVTVFGRIGP
jgi:alpha-tubulin suppressor-like RCC1 family protein